MSSSRQRETVNEKNGLKLNFKCQLTDYQKSLWSKFITKSKKDARENNEKILLIGYSMVKHIDQQKMSGATVKDLKSKVNNHMQPSCMMAMPDELHIHLVFFFFFSTFYFIKVQL